MTSPRDPAADRGKLRSFGLLLGGVLLAWACLRLYRGKPYGPQAAAVGGALALLGVAVPQLLRQPYRAWMALGHLLGAVNAHVLLFVTFWALMVPFGLLRRLFSGSALAARRRDLPGGGATYFNERKPDDQRAKHFENMF